MLFKLYGTALCQTVLEHLRAGCDTVSELADQIGQEGMSNAERHNLDRRIRRALSTLESEGYIVRKWVIQERPVLTFKIQSDVRET
ncbi:hypothetical protein [Phaeodactylibacter xiamenensis]|uniref:hypothetical protein n=1 Tax=Phaeodactylibacter xiamenensis TaxID=1524460 RepID=UPI0024A8DECC|nr:hypothetical protein [Phaeodactylibacter xiamenensis]